MNLLSYDWLAHELHVLRHEELLKEAERERLALSVLKSVAAQPGHVKRVAQGVKAGLRQITRREEATEPGFPAGRPCCPGADAGAAGALG